MKVSHYLIHPPSRSNPQLLYKALFRGLIKGIQFLCRVEAQKMRHVKKEREREREREKCVTERQNYLLVFHPLWQSKQNKKSQSVTKCAVIEAHLTHILEVKT